MPITVEARVSVCSNCGGQGERVVDHIQGQDRTEKCPQCHGSKVEVDFPNEAMSAIEDLVSQEAEDNNGR